jgi:hypothetical protein
MGITPIGIINEAIKKDETLKELEKMKAYLLAHQEEESINGKTLQEIEDSIKSIESFEFLT